MAGNTSLLWKTYHFSDLSLELLYQILRVRQEVFIFEQNCFYLDADGIDMQSIHLCGFLDEKLVAYARIIPQGLQYAEISFGRVLVSKAQRGNGEGKVLTQKIIATAEKYFGKGPIRISAQSYLQHFYESYGFRAVSKEYLDAGIPHIEMLRL